MFRLGPVDVRVTTIDGIVAYFGGSAPLVNNVEAAQFLGPSFISEGPYLNFYYNHLYSNSQPSGSDVVVITFALKAHQTVPQPHLFVKATDHATDNAFHGSYLV